MVEAQTKATNSPRRDVWCVQLEEVGHTKHLVLGYIRSVFKKLWASKAQNTFKAIVNIKILPRFRHLSLRWLQRTLTLTRTVSLSFLPVLSFTSISPIHAYAYTSPTATKNILFYLEVIFVLKILLLSSSTTPFIIIHPAWRTTKRSGHGFHVGLHGPPRRTSSDATRIAKLHHCRVANEEKLLLG